ncbi:MAG TPA: F0F1 ATP synthase subunit A [Terracidiphilus sp.]|jgi:F-type H+-transporting ATPase subunit a
MEQYAFTRLLNHLFGGVVTTIMQGMGLHPANPVAPIDNTFSVELLVVLGLIAFFIIVRLTLSPDKPGPAQHVAEIISEFTGSMGDQVIGHDAPKFQAYVSCIFLFVLINNLVGLIPGVPAPTTSPSVPLGLAVPTFLYYNFQGFRSHGIGYLKHFAGPIWWMAWLLIPIELVSHFARILSLTIRLYANMYASDMLTLGFFSLVPIGVPSIFLGLHVFVSCIQAFIFMLLTMIYLSLAVSHETH